MIKAFDLFGVSQFTLYRTKDQYRTNTGGAVSILIFGILLSIFIGMAIDTFNYTNITMQSENLYDTNPTYYKLTANPANKFMFAVGLSGGENFPYSQLNFSLFNFTIKNRINQDTERVSQAPLKPCNFSQWEGVSDSINKDFQALHIKNLLCPPSNYQFQLQGKPFSQVQKFFRIVVNFCPNSSSSCRVGKTTSPYLNGTFPQINLFHINTIINPSNKNPYTYYIQDIASFYLDLRNTLLVNVEFSEYKMETDWSLMPWSSTKYQTGIMTNGKSSIKSQRIFTNTSIFAYINIRKSSNRVNIKRQFFKITYVISFIGGLLNPILLFMSFIKIYNKFSLQIQLGFRIFRPNINSWFSSQNFNFWFFIKYGVFSLLDKINFRPKWKQIKIYCEYRAETIKQLDIYLLFKKIEMFEEVCATVLEEHHQIGLHLLARKTIKEAKKKRKTYLMQDLVYGKIDRQKKGQNYQEETFKKQRQKFLKLNPQQIYGEEQPSNKQTLYLHKQFSQNYKRLQQESLNGCKYSEKIMKRLRPSKKNDSLISINLSDDQQREEKEKEAPQIKEENLYADTEFVRSSQQTI